MAPIIAIPTFVVAMLGGHPQEIQTSMDVYHNVICWASPAQAVCFRYTDEGTHLAIELTTEQE